MGKGSDTTTSSNSPPQAVLDQYTSLTGQANQVAANPLNQYGGQMVAGFTPAQQQAFGTIDSSQGIQQPYINNANSMLQSSQGNVLNGVQQYSPDAINSYYSPYQNDVVNATQANMNETNAEQNQSVVGNAVSAGAWGGDRASVAQSELARQQGLADNQTLASLQNQGFQTAQGELNNQQQLQMGANTSQDQLALQGSYGSSSLGNTALNTALTGASAQLTAGGQQQQLAQSALNIPYEQFEQQQAFPYQDLSWLSGISTGLGSGMGGTSSTTTPGPSAVSQIAGLAASGLGAYQASDRRLKKNIEHIGMYKGYPLYNYEYKGSDTPQTGVMAQDVEKKNPDAVGKDKDGMRYVDYSKLARGGAAGFCPMNYDTGGNIPTIDLSFIPGGGFTGSKGGVGVPRFPAPVSQNNNSSNAITSILGKGLGKALSGSGAPSANQNLADSTSDISNMSNISSSLSGPFSTGLSGAYSGTSFARGGFTPYGYDNGGGVSASPTAATVPIAMASNPNSSTNIQQQLMAMPMEQLREYAVRYMGTPQGQMAQQVLQQKQEMPNLFSSQSQPAAQSQSSSQNVMQPKSPVQGFAAGGSPDDDTASPVILSSDDDSNGSQGFTPSNSVGSTSDSAGLSPAMQKYGMPTSFDGAGTAPINKPNPWMALAMAGAAAAAGRSPHALTNIGAGAMAGLKDYQDQKDEAAKESYQQGSIKQQGEQLFDNAVMKREDLYNTNQNQESQRAISQQQADQTGQYQRSEIDLRKQALEQGKFAKGADGQIYNTHTGDPKGGLIPGTEIPTDANGQPIVGDAYMQNLKATDTNRYIKALSYLQADEKLPPINSRTKPDALQALSDARIGAANIDSDGSINTGNLAERFPNRQKFEADNKGAMDSYNTIPSHISLLEKTAQALDNGDYKAVNLLKNTWKEQFGSELPTDLAVARQMVAGEITKAVTGAGGVTDRLEAAHPYSSSASDTQLSGAVGIAKNLIGERVKSQAYRYGQTVAGGDGRQYYHLMRPDTLNVLGIDPAKQPGAIAAPSAGATAQSANGIVKIKAPAGPNGQPGQTGSIPANRLQDYMKQGYTQVQ